MESAFVRNYDSGQGAVLRRAHAQHGSQPTSVVVTRGQARTQEDTTLRASTGHLETMWQGYLTRPGDSQAQLASPAAIIRKKRSMHVVQRDADIGKLSRRVSGSQPRHSTCEILRQGDFFPENLAKVLRTLLILPSSTCLHLYSATGSP